MDDELVAWGRVALVETTGRTTGRVARAAVGYVEEPDGSLLVAAGDPGAAWAQNLLADPRCVVTIGDDRTARRAVELDDGERSQAVAALILRYGTPAERLGRGPAFRLVRDPG
ncbi:MAG: nitroreductase family deazaflavin-dependent oxidoreductase [Chloroflexota bacterium]|jgi:deazaflavin-dependent oxidoreductase (nitroreductase family)